MSLRPNFDLLVSLFLLTDIITLKVNLINKRKELIQELYNKATAQNICHVGWQTVDSSGDD